MFTHSFAIILGLVAIIIAKKPPCHHRTFGLFRAEVLAAFINGLFLLLVVGIIIYEAFQRIIRPVDILGFEMLIIAFIGLAVNIASIIILHGSHKHNLNIRSVFYHMVADAVSSIGIIIAALIILLTGWNIIDPLVSIGISILIIIWAWRILKESTKILLETAPKGLDIDVISNELKKEFSEIDELFNVHIWTITSEMIVFSAHLTLNKDKKIVDKENFILKINNYLKEKYNIIESTIQIGTDESKTC
jgi:cobalt-zinc-cadmium efflux system protein